MSGTVRINHMRTTAEEGGDGFPYYVWLEAQDLRVRSQGIMAEVFLGNLIHAWCVEQFGPEDPARWKSNFTCFWFHDVNDVFNLLMRWR